LYETVAATWVGQPPVRERQQSYERELVGIAVGTLGSIGLATLLVLVRGQIDNANAALALVLPVLGGAVIGGRRAGIASAIVATLSFDFFFTTPYLSLKMDHHNDIETTAILLIVALIVAEIGIRARHNRGEARAKKDELDRFYRVAELAARASEAADVVMAVQAELIGLFELEDCWYEASGAAVLPRLGRNGAIEDAPLRMHAGEFELPTDGVELPVRARGKSFGRLVLVAHEGTPASLAQRRVAVALADELGLVLASSRHLEQDLGIHE
jgi:K+-sensing histidine kinase KdpD